MRMLPSGLITILAIENEINRSQLYAIEDWELKGIESISNNISHFSSDQVRPRNLSGV